MGKEILKWDPKVGSEWDEGGIRVDPALSTIIVRQVMHSHGPKLNAQLKPAVLHSMDVEDV